MKKYIKFDWPLLPGSVSTAKSRCGKPGCVCKADAARLHGTYYRWTGFIEGTRTTKTVTKRVAAECRRRIERFRKLQEKMNTLAKEALRHAPWTSGQDRRKRNNKR